jgi:hypothetical protein
MCACLYANMLLEPNMTRKVSLAVNSKVLSVSIVLYVCIYACRSVNQAGEKQEFFAFA